VAVKGSEVEVGASQRLFHTGSPGIGISFDVSSDGKRLLVTDPKRKRKFRFGW